MKNWSILCHNKLEKMNTTTTTYQALWSDWMGIETGKSSLPSPHATLANSNKNSLWSTNSKTIHRESTGNPQSVISEYCAGLRGKSLCQAPASVLLRPPPLLQWHLHAAIYPALLRILTWLVVWADMQLVMAIYGMRKFPRVSSKI